MTAQSTHIFLVEDDYDLRNSLKEILEEEGYRVSCAGDGQEALQVLRSLSPYPSLIFLDLMMPVLDGYGFRRAQVADPLLAQIPVVIMSADGQVDKNRAQTQAVAYVRKPFDLEDILDAVERYAI